jgi:hypothetical protein
MNPFPHLRLRNPPAVVTSPIASRVDLLLGEGPHAIIATVGAIPGAGDPPEEPESDVEDAR